jgi:hypothetical protein
MMRGRRASDSEMTSETLPTSTDLRVPEVLQSALGVYKIRIDDRRLTVKYKKSAEFKGDIAIVLTGDWQFTDSAEIGFKAINKGFSTDSVDLLRTHIGNVLASPEASDIMAAIKVEQNKAEEQRFEHSLSKAAGKKKSTTSTSGKASELSSQTVTTMKYTVKKKLVHGQKEQEKQDDSTQALPILWETVKIAGAYYLVCYDPFAQKLRFTTELPVEEENNMMLVPYTEKAADPYDFADAKELRYFIEKAKKETLGTLFSKARKCVKTFYDTDNEAHTNLIAADIVFTYFQDRLGKTHYIFLYGKPGTGKGAVLETFGQLAYRGVQITNANAPNLYRMLGDLEKGQVVIIIDEANRLEDDPFLQEVLKTGYKGNARVARMLDASSAANSKQRYYYTFCFKIIAANKLPTDWKVEGVLDRCFKIKTAPGNPTLDIGDIVDHADDPKNAKVLEQLQYLRKLLFAYRLLHYSEPIPDIRLKEIIGRDAELVKPLIRLFKTHGGSSASDLQNIEDIKKALHYFIKERTEDKTDSFEAYLQKEITELIDSREWQLTEEDKKSKEYVEGIRSISFSDLWDRIIKEKLKGEEIEGERDSLNTSLFGPVSKKRFAGGLRALGGDKARDSTRDKRIWKFNFNTLARFGRAFVGIPDKIELEEQETLDLAAELAAFNFMDEEEEQNEETPLVSDTSGRFERSTDDNRGSEKNLSSENHNEIAGHDEEISGNGQENMENVDVKNNLEGGSSSNNRPDRPNVSERSRDVPELDNNGEGQEGEGGGALQ